MNRELVQLFGEPSILKVVKAERIYWTGHYSRKHGNSPVKMMFVSIPVGREIDEDKSTFMKE